MVCTQLGFQGASSFIHGSHFGNVYPNFAYDNIGCVGYEIQLDQCPHSDVHDCGGGEAAGVICIP